MMNDFIDFAREKSVNKFVLLSASQAEAGDPSLGQVHGHLKKLSTEQGVQWVVIRPTWFIGNSVVQTIYFLLTSSILQKTSVNTKLKALGTRIQSTQYGEMERHLLSL